MAAGAKIFAGSPSEVQSNSEVRRVYLGEPS
jgi:ABC-type branched-subunit amino acid transport system ATPase component